MKNKIGIDTIIILVSIVVVAILLIIALANKGEQIDGKGGEGSSTSQTSMSQAVQQANDADILKFNAKINGFSGTQTGQNLKALFKNINELNNNNPDRQITVTGITSEDQLDEDNMYNVSMSKDEDGYYTKIKIEEKK